MSISLFIHFGVEKNESVILRAVLVDGKQLINKTNVL